MSQITGNPTLHPNAKKSSEESPTHLNLQRGWPSTRLCARQALFDSVQDVLAPTQDMSEILLYGPGVGYAPLRESIANWLSEDVYSQVSPLEAEALALAASATAAASAATASAATASAATASAATASASSSSDPSRICVTNGASAALSSVVLKFADPSYTRRIFMIEPTYFLACPIFEDCGFRGRLRGVPEGGREDCVDLEFLLDELSKVESETDWPDQPLAKTGPQYPHIYKYIFYCTTTFMNPSAKTMPLWVRQELVKLAREFDILLVSDDVYDFLHWSPQDPSVKNSTSNPLPPRLVDVDRTLPGTSLYGNAISNGSFSKIIGPGIRVGWVEAQQEFASHLGSIGSTTSGGNPTHFASTIVEHTLRTGSLQKHIRDIVVPEYQQRYHSLLTSFHQHLIPLGYEVDLSSHQSGLAGGFFAYLRLPLIFITHRVFAKTVAAIALREFHLRIAFGHMFVVAGDEGSVRRAERDDGFAYCMRLCWAWMETGELLEAVNRLAECTKVIQGRIETGEGLSSFTG